MAYNYEYPYTDPKLYNDDWMLHQVISLAEQWKTVQGDWENQQEAFESLKTYVQNYFANLDVGDEINAKIEAMVQSGEFAQIVSPYLPNIVDTWLSDHITNPSNPPLDDTFMLEGAAAQSAAVGAKLFYADRRILTNDDDANLIKEPGSYAKPASVVVANLPNQQSGYLTVLTRGSNLLQLWVTNLGNYYIRYNISSDWYWLNGQDNVFLGSRGVMADGSDAQSFTKPGSYAKPYANDVINVPTKSSAIMSLLASIGTSFLRFYSDLQGRSWTQRNNAEWNMIGMPNHYGYRLYGKTMIGIGDSLMYAQGLTRAQSWFNLIGSSYEMDYYNYAVSGTSIAVSDVANSMVERLAGQIADNDTCDYFILEGGANDQAHNVPLGDTDSTNINEFSGAINTIITEVKEKYQGVRILLMTNWDRKLRGANSLGLRDEDYVNQMIAVAKYRGIPYFDNYHDLGVSKRNVSDRAWYFLADDHISIEGNIWSAPVYAKKLETI